MLRDPANSDIPLDRIMHALANPLRRALLEQIKDEPVAVSTLAEHARITLPAMSRHLRLLEKAGLIDREKQGRVHLISLRQSRLRIAQEWLAGFHLIGTENQPEFVEKDEPESVHDTTLPHRDTRASEDKPAYEEPFTSGSDQEPVPPEDTEQGPPDLSPEALDELLRKLHRR